MKPYLFLFALIGFLTGHLCSAALASGRHNTKQASFGSKIPRDLKVVAQYGPGESDAKWWTATIRADGRAIQTVYGKRSQALTVTDEQRNQLVAALQKEDFWSLSKEYPIEAKDGPTLLITVTANGRSSRGAVFLPSDRPKSAEVRRFLRIWSLILTLVPSPNPDQTPAAYSP